MTISSNLTASTKASWTSSRASRQLGASYSNSDCIQVMRGQRLSETRLREGTIDLVTVLQAQQTLFTAEDNYSLARLARLQAVLSLYQALGGGWLPPGVAAGVNVLQ